MRTFDQKTYFELDYSEVDDMVNKYFDIQKQDKYDDGYSCVDYEELNNYSMKPYRRIETELDEFTLKFHMKDIAQALLSKKAGDLPHLGAILNYLCHKGEIPPGDYLINISW